MAIQKKRELQVILQMLENQFHNFQSIEILVNAWNLTHAEFTKEELSSAISSTRAGKQGAIITIWVASNGKVRLMAVYDKECNANKSPKSEESRKKYN